MKRAWKAAWQSDPAGFGPRHRNQLPVTPLPLPPLRFSFIARGKEQAVRLGTLAGDFTKGTTMAWTTPSLVEICIGLEINGYLPAEF
jgi:coenzyme PQQ precursor peptide PqqA